jgi:hypothetical protein
MIRSVLVQVHPQSEGDPGQITEGFFKVEDGYLQMTYRDGRPLDNPLYRVELPDGVRAEQVAAKLAKAIRLEISGEIVPGFNRRMSYPKAVVA